jgi:iron(III) transport system substrate-binding protein
VNNGDHPPRWPPPWLIRRGPIPIVLALGAIFIALSAWLGAASRRGAPRADALVVYCTVDPALAEKILRDFEQRSGLPLTIRYESDPKSPGLATRLLREKQDAPRGDVLWSDDLLGTLDLEEHGLLLPYRGPGFARIPTPFKAADGSWAGCAARLRVILANTAKLGTTPPNLDALLPGDDRSRIAATQPLHGTALAHYTVLWHLWGGARVRLWWRDWQHGGIREMHTRAAVRDAVGRGACYAGFADSDDFFAARAAGQPVAMHPVRLEGDQTICLPHTIAILRGTPRETAARRLVDHLLSAETELALARSPAHFIPLGPVPAGQLPEEVRELRAWAQDGADLTRLGSARVECLAWLKTEYPP